MRTYGQFCPIAVGAEVFAERWTPLVIRELFAGSTHFNAILRGIPRMPRATLVQRLRALEGWGVVERRDAPASQHATYHLTAAGRELAEVAIALGVWAKRWGHANIREDLLDPDFLLWDIHRGINLDLLPDRRVVVQIDLHGQDHRSYWLIVERPEPSLCLTDPGFEPDLLVIAETVALHRVWMGELEYVRAVATEAISLDGAADLRRAFPGWLALGYFSNVPSRTSATR